MHMANKLDNFKIIFVGVPLFFLWWVLVFTILAFLSRDEMITIYGSILALLISIPIYIILVRKFASQLDVTIDASQKSFFERIRSGQTWKQADQFLLGQYTGPIRIIKDPIKPEDYFPLDLSFIKLFIIILPVGLLLFISWIISKIVFFIVLGLTIPLSLGSFFLINYLIDKYIVTEKTMTHNLSAARDGTKRLRHP